MWTEVERPDDVEGNFAVEAEALKANGGNLLAVLVEGANLSRRARLERKMKRRISRTVCTDSAAILREKE